MLNLAFLSSPDQKKIYLEDFISQVKLGQNPTWIVSDLRNKFEIQNSILKVQDHFEDLNVIRASELWKFLFKRTHPEWKIISNEFLKTWIRQYLRKRPEGLSALSSAQSDQVVYEMMNLMAPLLGHQDGQHKIREWFSANPESLQRWGGWYLLAEELYEDLVKEKRTSLYWMSSLLQSDDTQWSIYWKRPLIFDLGSQINQTEAEIIKNLGQDHDVLVLAPEIKSDSDFKYLLKPYQFLQGYSQKTSSSEKPNVKKQSQTKALRFSGPLAEAKKACEQVRQWLDQKISPSQIGVIASDIEQYWPLLDSLFETEGIPVAKDRMARLQSLPAVAEWISQLKIVSKDFNYSDLETAVYFQEKPDLRFEEFYGLFSEMLTDADLKRHQMIEKAFKGNLSSKTEIGMEEFIGVSLRFWKDRGQFGFLEICIRELMAHAELPIFMNLTGWINYLSQIIAKKEIAISRGISGGVQMTNLSSADSVDLSHRIFLGLTESMVQNHRKTMISSDETNSISSNIGFDLLHPEASTDEFDLEWLSWNPNCQDIYSYPQTGFSGSAEAPCALWLAQGGREELDLPKETRWDYLKKNLTEIPVEAQKRIDQDLGLQILEPLKLIKEISLSPSSIESYRKCPFIFASQKLFRLMDFPILDLDVDRRTRGLLAHALLEKLTLDPTKNDFSSDEIREILENLRQPLGLDSMDDFIWQGIKEKHRIVGERFLEFERSWRKQFPETKTVAAEKNFEFQFNENWRIKGKIDRIDSDSAGNLVIIDYKASPGDHKNFNAWLSENQIQLALYMLALESNVVPEFESREVIGAFYYVLKTMNRDKGLKLEEKAGSLFDLDRKKNRISSEKKLQLLKDVSAYVAETVQAISQGLIDPVPLDPKDCATCHWRSLCRAPHLN